MKRASHDCACQTNRLALLLALMLLLVLGISVAEACNVPVFRYALEQWYPDPYRVTILHRGPLSTTEQATVERLHAAADKLPSNMVLQLLDVDELAKADDPLAKLAAQAATDPLPRIVVQYPLSLRDERPIYTAPLQETALDELLGSPLRNELIQRLTAGQTAVWLMLESGQAEQDDAVAAQLQAELTQLAEKLQLPDLTTAPEDSLLSDLPLRVEFSLLRIVRNDPREQALVAMLLRSEDDLAELDQPLVFPVFGRGRAMLPLVGQGITTNNIHNSAEFLVGACSCEIKELNPGFDLLLAADWDLLLFKASATPEEQARRAALASGEPVLVPIPSGAGAAESASTTPPSSDRASGNQVASAPADNASPAQDDTFVHDTYVDVEHFEIANGTSLLLLGLVVVAILLVIMIRSRRNQQTNSRSPKKPSRQGAISWVVLLLMAVVAITALGLLWRALESGSSATPNADSDAPLVVYCAASNQAVFEAVRRDYQDAYGREIHVQYGPSQTLLASAAISQSGDLLLPADDSYIDLAAERKLSAEVFPLARMRAVVAVAQGNPKNIQSLDDLLRADVRLVQASPEGAAIGKLTRERLTALGRWDALDKATDVYKTTVNEVANDVKLGTVDAGIVFDAVLHDYPTLEVVRLPELGEVVSDVSATILTSSKQPRAALHFARFLAARDKGLTRYREFGFASAEGDLWSDAPEVTLYAGSMLRPAIERTITAFEEREGVRVLRVYNGCGILVAQMQAGQVPDAYFACDTEFMQQVESLFPGSENISQNELVILVHKGNPHGIRSLSDLGQGDLRVGIGHEKQCAMGWLTQRTFREGGVQQEVMKNVVVQTPTGDMLVNQMRTGSLDAAVAYLSNAAGSADALDAIRIQGLPCSVAVQPFGMSKASPHQQTLRRLLAAIRAEQSHQVFSQEGFGWLEPTAQP